MIGPLCDLGVEARPEVWDGPADWTAYDLVVIRATWDYAERRGAFLRWAESLARVLNPAPVLRWNTDKRYLGELAEEGLPVVPTRFLEPGEPLDAPDGEFVVKPTVSAGARDTARFRPEQAGGAASLVEAIHASGRAAMVQPYLHDLDEHGETAMVFIGGAFSHAIRKGALLPPDAPPVEGLFAHEHITRREPSGHERELAEAVYDWARRRFGELLYARVDIAPPGLLLELEVTEPSLFLGHGDGAPERLAQAISAYAK